MIKLSVKKPYLTLVAVTVVLMLAAVSLTRMTTDLLPTISTPYIMVVTTYPGASPERVEMDVTDPLESALGTVNGVENVTSTSAENFSLITLEFEDDTDMDSALVKVNTAIDTVEGNLPELCSTPNLLEISMDMLATMYVAVERDDMDVYELTDYVSDTLTPYFQRQTGVANVTTLGLVEESVEIRINPDKVSQINDKLAAQVAERLNDAKAELDDAQAELDRGKAELESGKTELENTQTSTANQLAEATKQMNEALATQSAYNSILASQQANIVALQTELQAYQDAGVVDSYNQINDMFASLHDSVTDPDAYTDTYNAAYDAALIEAVQQQADNAALEITVTADNVQEVFDQLDAVAQAAAQTAAAAQGALAAAAQGYTIATGIPTDIADALANPDKLETARQMLSAAGQDEAAQMLTADNLSQLSNIVNTRIPQIEGELNNLQVEAAANQAVLEGVNSVLSAALDNYAQMEAGKMAASIGFSTASANIASGESALEQAQAQLDEAAKAYEDARDAALKAANLDQVANISTLSSLIYAQNFTMPAGYIDDAEDNQWLLKVGDEFDSVEELRDQVLTNIDGIGDITLGDVADVTVIDNAADSYARMNGKDAVLLSIYKGSTAGTSAVSKTCNEAIADLMAEQPDLHITVLMDQGDYIQIFLSSIMSNMIFGALLAVLVLALFLRSVRPTLVVAFSIPFSVLVAVLIMYFTGITLNIMSMSGLALGIGMLVDNSIVVIENIYRLRGRGIPAPRAAVQGAKQVAGAIISSTITTVCVFLPMIFTSGMVRELMVPFALTISFALLASLVVALTVAPTMSSVLFRRAQPKESKLFAALLRGYGKALDFCLRRKFVPLGVAVLLLAFSIYQVAQMGIVLLPEMNSDQIYLAVFMDEDTPMEDCYARADDLSQKLLAVDGVEEVGAMTNLSGVISTSLVSTSNNYLNYTYYLVLDESVDTTDELDDVTGRIETMMEQETGLTYSLAQSSMGDMSSLLASGLSVSLYGQDVDQLAAVAKDVMAMAESIEGFSDASDGQEDGDAVIHLAVDKDEAMRHGLTVAQIYSAINSRLTTQQVAATITIDGEEMRVTVVDESKLLTAENLLEVELDTTTVDEDGATVNETHALGEFAEVEHTTGLASIRRENGAHVLTVTATTEEGYNTTRLAQQLQTKLDNYQAPKGVTIEIAGEAEEVNDMLSQMINLLLLGAALVYLVMVAQFQSLLSPFIILFTVPLAFTGGLIGMLLFGDQLSIVSLLGFLVLLGTVVNNGIVFVDYTNQLRLGGLGKREALIATGQARMRPILMTALTTILSMSTMMFSRDLTANMSRGMAVVVAGGLLYATLMTLFIVPVMYDLLYRRQPKVIDVGDDLDDAPDDAAEYLAALEQQDGE